MSYCSEKFSFMWRVTNFKTQVQEGEKVFHSPKFVANYIEKSVWFLRLEDFDNKCQLELHLWDEVNTDTPLNYNFNFTIFCNNGENVTLKDVRHGFRNQDYYPVELSFSFQEIEKNESKYLNGECLRIHFSMWKDVRNSFDVIRITGDVEDFETSSSREQEHSFMWNIVKFGVESEVEKKIFIDMFVFVLKLIISDEKNVEVLVENLSIYENDFKVNCEVLSSHTEIQKEKLELQHQQSSKKTKVLSFPSFSNENKLAAIKNDFVRNGVLSFSFTVTLILYSFNKSLVAHEFVSSIQPWVKARVTSKCKAVSDNNFTTHTTCTSYCTNLRNIWEKAYICKKWTDVTLKVNDRSLKAHKMVLASMSPVFSAMFEQDMSENKSGIISIKEMEYDTLESVIFFIYCAHLKELSYEKAKKLIIAADRYQIDSLREHCVIFLKQCLSVKTVCEILHLSDMISDEELKYSAITFFITHSKTILITEEWKKLKKNKNTVAFTVLENWALST